MVFHKSQFQTTDNLWFCKWGTGKTKKRNTAKVDSATENTYQEVEEVSDIITRWRNRKDPSTDPAGRSFAIPVNYIKTNNYSLSFNDYKLIRQQGPREDDNENTIDPSETVLTAKKENLQDFFETSELLPERKRRRRLAPVLIVLLVLLFGGAAFYWFYLKGNPDHFFSSSKISDSASNISFSNSSKQKETDSSLINHNAVPNGPAGVAVHQEEKIPEPGASEKDNKLSATAGKITKYTVINKAWFHSEPDPTKIKPVYLKPRKDVVLTPQAEENGFVYVVYVNSKGQSTRGWLNKKNLEAVE